MATKRIIFIQTLTAREELEKYFNDLGSIGFCSGQLRKEFPDLIEQFRTGKLDTLVLTRAFMHGWRVTMNVPVDVIMFGEGWTDDEIIQSEYRVQRSNIQLFEGLRERLARLVTAVFLVPQWPQQWDTNPVRSVQCPCCWVYGDVANYPSPIRMDAVPLDAIVHHPDCALFNEWSNKE